MMQHIGTGMTSQRTRDRLVQRLSDEGIRSQVVLEAVRAIPRHIFVDEALASRAYEDTALPIGHGQTISQPYIVARMTEALLENSPCRRVLEVGTGSGYQAAILAGLVDEVYTVERNQDLLYQARKRLRELRLGNVYYKHTDGTWGWPEKAPFDGIVVTAAPAALPEILLDQLAVGGAMVIPVGARGSGGAQELQLIVRKEDCFEQHVLEYVSFVPLLGGTL